MIAGSAIIIFGLATLLGSLGVFNFGDVFGTWWPLLVILGGLLVLASTSRQYVWGIIIILAGVGWQLEALDVIDFSVWQLFWPLVLIGAGWSIVRNRDGSERREERHENASDISVFLGGIETRNDSADYAGGKISTVLGGSTLDLRKATIKKEATLEVFAMMGGVEIKVPEGWAVDSQITPVMAGVENKTLARASDKAPVLRLVGTVFMGGVEIKH